LENVRTFWLHTDSEPESKYLLLEDSDTGDILMPLIYMKGILEANYSRKLASLKHRMVQIPANNTFSHQQGLMYWQWAFESSHAIKVLVRREIGESSPQGHLRLVLIPIVYNALAMRSEFHHHPLFLALHRVMRTSNYWAMLLHPSPDVLATLDQETGIANIQDPSQILFRGPKIFESTALKYMFMFKSLEELEASKRTRTTAAPSQDQILPVQTAQEESGGHEVGIGVGEQSASLQGGLGDILALNQSVGSLPRQERNQSQTLPVPLTTDQLKVMMDSKFNEIFREISTIKTSIVGMMNYLVCGILDNDSAVHLTDGHYHNNASTAPDLMHYDHVAFGHRDPSEGKVHQYSAGQGQRFSPYPTVSTGQQIGSQNNSLSLRSPVNVTGSARTDGGHGLPATNSHQGEDAVDLHQAYSLLQTLRNSLGPQIESHVIPRRQEDRRIAREEEYRRDRMAATVNRENDHLIIPQGSASQETPGSRLLSDDERTEST
jgi:hypothetical protein